MSSSRKTRRKLTPGQREAIETLERLAKEDPEFAVVSEAVDAGSGELVIGVRLDVRDLDRVAGGLPLAPDTEEVFIPFSTRFPDYPSFPFVDHDRFVGQPHVLQGSRLCIYLDLDREWHPSHGARGVIARLRGFFADGAAARFDPRFALYHPVGGVHHRTPGAPTVVIRPSFTPVADARYRRASIERRTDHRFDLVAWHSGAEAALGEAAFVVILERSLPHGAGLTTRGLLASIAGQDRVRLTQTIGGLLRTARANPSGSPLFVVLAVPTGPHKSDHHLLVGRLSPMVADRLRSAGASDPTGVDTEPTSLPLDKPVEWCLVSDERPELSVRRDGARPVNAFNGRAIEVWGCGGLGSWIAEFVVRAGATSVTLRDHSEVLRGLLVRQNYTEDDVGRPKASALAARLRAISDDVEVAVAADVLRLRETGGLPTCDVIFDATVSNTVAAFLDATVVTEAGRPLIAQVSTDVKTGSLGLVVAIGTDWPGSVSDLDAEIRDRVECNRDLERFRVFWDQAAPSDEIVPARGCSVPTFHGSAADMAAVAGCLVSFVGRQFTAGVSGAHLFALPTAGGEGKVHIYHEGTRA